MSDPRFGLNNSHVESDKHFFERNLIPSKFAFCFYSLEHLKSHACEHIIVSMF
jgi:hypothetical protein